MRSILWLVLTGALLVGATTFVALAARAEPPGAIRVDPCQLSFSGQREVMQEALVREYLGKSEPDPELRQTARREALRLTLDLRSACRSPAYRRRPAKALDEVVDRAVRRSR